MERKHNDIRVTGLDSSVATKDPEGTQAGSTGFAWTPPEEVPHWAELFTPPAGSDEEDKRFAELYAQLPHLWKNLMADGRVE